MLYKSLCISHDKKCYPILHGILQKYYQSHQHGVNDYKGKSLDLLILTDGPLNLEAHLGLRNLIFQF